MKLLPFCALFGIFCAPASLFPLAAAPATPPISTPQKGEIALEGMVTTIESATKSFQLSATAFATPNGFKTLAAPKIKSVKISEATQFWNEASGENLALNALKIGLKVTVLGTDGGAGQPLLARAVIWKAAVVAPAPAASPPVTSPVVTAPAEALNALTTPEIAALLPPAQTAGGVTLQIIDGGIKPMDQMFRHPQAEKRPVFFFSYRLSGPPPAGKNDWGAARTLNDVVKIKRLFGPQGQILSAPGLGTIGDSKSWGAGQRVFVNDLDPRWEKLTAEWEILDPTAPPEANGRVTSPLVFEHLAVPAAGQEVPINRTLQTASGASLTLEKATLEKIGPDKRAATNFWYHWTPPPDVPDLKLTLDITKVESNGAAWQSNSGGGSYSGFSGSHRIDAAPPADAKEMAVTFKILEVAPSLQDRKWFSRLQMTIPVAALVAKSPPIVPTTDPPTVLAEAKGPGVRIQAEVRDRSWGNGWGGWLWIKSEEAAKGTSWLVREVQGTDEKGAKLNAWTFPLGGERQFWRADGNMAAPNEYAQPVVAVGEKKPAQINLSLKLEKARRLEHWSVLSGLSLPPPGQTREFKDGEIEEDFLAARRLISFQNVDALPGAGDRAKWFKSKQGLALVVEVSPVFPGAELDLRALSAGDDTGRDWGENSYWILKGDLTQKGTENTKFYTVILPPPPKEAKSLELRFSTVETAWSGQTQMLNLQKIAVK